MRFMLLLNRARFELIRLLYPRYITKRFTLRKGCCNNCGYCCGNCKYREDERCTIYMDRFKFNPICRPFPIDELDKEIVAQKCTYYWEKGK